jgi:RNA polymerase sigma-70 factor (ECF subfamily)
MPDKNDDWFVGIFSRYSRTLRRYLRRYSVSEETAADVAQEAFLRVYIASRSDTVRHPRAYLYQIARNLILNHIRNQSRAGTDTVPDVDDLGIYDDFPSLEAACISREEFEILVGAIEALPPQCQRVFILRKIYQYSYQEIVDELGIALSTVEKHVAQGVKCCHRYLEAQRGVGELIQGASDHVVKLRYRADG